MPVDAPAVHPPSTATAGEDLAAKFWTSAPRGIRPIAVFPSSSDTERWVVEVSGTSSFVLPDLAVRPRPLLGEFIKVHRLSGVLGAIGKAAASAFGQDVAVNHALVNDPDLGGDVIRVDVRTKGLSREEFRSARATFDSLLEAQTIDGTFERVVVVASRGD